MNLAPIRGILACLLLTLATTAQAQQRYVEGVHYQRLATRAYAQAHEGSSRSVVEVFWYGCGGCYAFDPLLNDWVARKGANIAFARAPIVWDANTKHHARLFYTTQALGLHAMHARIFDEIHQEKNYLLDEESSAALFAEFGVDAASFRKAFDSFGVDAELRKAETRQRETFIAGVPALIVDGTWLINTSAQVPSQQAMLDVADFLLASKP